MLCVFAAFTKTMSLVGGFGGFGNFGTPVAQPAFGGCAGRLSVDFRAMEPLLCDIWFCLLHYIVSTI